ncbi:hypothetical protein ACFFHK_04570 [Gallibacterium trehalosifermentans]|uniref:Competence protein ComB n=1 Tax=Gallibacterium trehalosifermentans TaxID=516935 RepID=A0ABV6H0T9_9PAST
MINKKLFEINLLDWRQQHYRRRYRQVSIFILLLIIIVSLAGYRLLTSAQQQSARYHTLNQQQQALNNRLQQVKQDLSKQQHLLSEHSSLEKVPLNELVYFVQFLSHLPLGNGRLSLAQIEASSFANEQKAKLHFMIMGENIAQQEFYQLQQYLLTHWPYPITLEPTILTSKNTQKHTTFTLRFQQKEAL